MMTEPPANHSSPYWSKTTKVIVVIFILLGVLLLMWRFQSLNGMLVMAAILGYLLEPIISRLDRRLTISRGLIIALIYIILAVAIISGFSALGFASFQQFGNLINLMPGLIEDVAQSVAEFVNRTEPLIIGPIVIRPILIPWDRITTQLLEMLNPVLTWTRCGQMPHQRLAVRVPRTPQGAVAPSLASSSASRAG